MNSSIFRRSEGLLIATVALLGTGCGVDVELAEDLATDPPERVAILPFEAPDSDERGSLEMRFIRRIYYHNWANLPFRTMPLPHVDRLLAEHGFADVGAVLAAEPGSLSEMLGVDAVIRGRVDSFSNFAPLFAYRRAISGEFELVECRKDREPGRVLWKADYTESSWGGPLLESGQVIKGIRHQIENSSGLAFYRITDRFCRKIVETMPPLERKRSPEEFVPKFDPQMPVAVRPSRPGPLRAGDRIEVEVRGEAGQDATFDIGLFRHDVPMAEVAPGRFVGVYVVQAGDAVEGAQVRARLSTVFGESALADAAATAITIRARPPAAPRDLVAKRDGTGVVLSWAGGSPEAPSPRGAPRADGSESPADPERPVPAAAYIVSRAVGDPLDFAEIGEARGRLDFVDDAAGPPSGPVHYQVAAVDEIGNRSYPTPFVTVGGPETPIEGSRP